MKRGTMKTWTDDDFATQAGEQAYVYWLLGEYGKVASNFPPASVVCFEGYELHEFAVIGYAVVEFEDETEKPTVKLLNLAEMSATPYEKYPERSRTICPTHELPKLKYLYNQNGQQFADKFKR